LQKVLGDDNVLIVRFDDIDIPRGMNGDAYFGIYYTYYRHVAEDGILLGLRRYCFFSKMFILDCHVYLNLCTMYFCCCCWCDILLTISMQAHES
jgi:hypothetical protein